MMLAGRSVISEPLEARMALLEKKVLPKLKEPVRHLGALDAKLPDLVASVKAQGLEGLVAKRRDSRYEAGMRSGAWPKMRVNRGQESRHRRLAHGTTTFDALVFGVYENGKLLGRPHVQRLTPATRVALMKTMKPLETAECPFVNLPSRAAGAGGKGSRRPG
jgi:bifunctional non-homologous end joining protein LigD